MKRRRRLALLGLCLLASATAPSGPVAAGEDGPSVGTPPEGQLYHGLYPGGRTGWEDDITPADLATYEAAAGAEAAWVYFSHNWFRSPAFPIRKATWIREQGAVPFIRLMLRTANPPRQGHPYTLDRIIRGDFDTALRRWGRAATAFGDPLVVEYGTEVNGEWFGWNGAWVDWVGLSSYGALTPADRPGDWEDFRVALDRVVPRLAAMAPDKPVFVFEFGFTDHNPSGSAADFADAALDDLLSGRWPEVRGFSWWNETWENDDDPAHDTDMRVPTVPGLSEVFQDHLASNPAVVTQPLP